MNILITGGGCREPVDSVRCITNMSTGKTAAFLADSFASRGISVTTLMAEQSVMPESAQYEAGRSRLLTYKTGAELASLLEKELTEHAYDAVIHAAAVSDFRPSVITVNGKSIRAGKAAGKIPSGTQMTVTFEPTPKIAGSLKQWAAEGNRSGRTVIVCFKLTDSAGRMERRQASAVILEQGTADYVVSNDLTEIGSREHPFELFSKKREPDGLPESVCTGKTLSELAESLICATDIYTGVTT
jgi:phosphopantothenate---cysteine ligase (CTP)